VSRPNNMSINVAELSTVIDKFGVDEPLPKFLKRVLEQMEYQNATGLNYTLESIDFDSEGD
jgi:hypothetical protein